jgi:hypothetical protein
MKYSQYRGKDARGLASLFSRPIDFRGYKLRMSLSAG